MKDYINWEILFAIPNINLTEPLESKFIAIVPSNDNRILNIIIQHPKTKYLINRFTDQFNREVSPSFLIIRSDSPNRLWHIDAIMDFRNVFATSIILYGWQDILRSPNVFYPLYSNYFNFYPITISKHNDGYITSTPAIRGWDDPESFHGQTDASLNNFQIDELMPDKEFYTLLQNCWTYAYLKGKKSKKKYNVVFRSLEMAMQALSIPFSNNNSINEYGTRIALWISSFETLTRSLSNHVDLKKVLTLMDKIDWENKRLSYKYYKGMKNYPKINLPQKIYYDLYNSRNNFLY